MVSPSDGQTGSNPLNENWFFVKHRLGLLM